MGDDHRQALQDGPLPDELTAALEALDEAAELVINRAHPGLRPRLSVLLQRVFDNALRPDDVPAHWWETSLAYLRMEEEKQTGDAFARAAARVQPLLLAHLGPYDDVTLQAISAETVGGICLLSETMRPPQMYAVAPNAYSLAQAHFYPQAWFRAIYAGRAPVGFIMLSDDTKKPEYFLWRFMIAPQFQGRGYGRAAIERLVEYVRTRPGATELLVSCILGEGSPVGFYERVGFESTGQMEGVELVLRLGLG